MTPDSAMIYVRRMRSRDRDTNSFQDCLYDSEGTRIHPNNTIITFFCSFKKIYGFDAKRSAFGAPNHAAVLWSN